MQRLEDFLGKAAKIKGDGFIYYEIWHDENEVLYVRMTDNEVETNKPGTFTGMLYSVSRYMNLRNTTEKLINIEGFDLGTSSLKIAEDNNDGGFLKAVLCDLFTSKIQESA